MLERYFLRAATVDRIRASWFGDPIERYVTLLTELGYKRRTVFQRVPTLVRFGEFAHRRGARTWAALPEHVDSFVDSWLAQHREKHATEKAKKAAARALRGPIHQLLRLVLPGFSGERRAHTLPDPFEDRAPGFFKYLISERGLRTATITQYGHHLRRFEAYLRDIGLHSLSELSPIVLSSFITERSRVLSKASLQKLCSVLKIFLRYLHRESLARKDLSPCIESPQQYRLAHIPRSISWDDVRRVLEVVDRRNAVGKRDYAILLLLVTYGLRAREVAALSLDDIDWKRERLRVPERKAGHSTAYPLSPVVADAVLDYLQHGRPDTSERALFLRPVAPHTPVTYTAVSLQARRYLREAGIEVPRPGSHTLRHACVQRLLDAHVSLKTIGDYVGHRSPEATKVYTKVAIEDLREVAIGDGEELA